MDATSPTEDLFSFNGNGVEAPPENHPGREVSKRDFINRINYANFENIPLTVIFRHKVFGRSITLRALSEPCISDKLFIKWSAEPDNGEDLNNFELDRVMIPGFDHSLSLYPVDHSILDEGILITLPESAFEMQRRIVVREQCKAIDVLIIQNGTMFTGVLKNFHSLGFLVSMDKNENTSLKLLNLEENVSLLIKKDKEMIFSGMCSLYSPREHMGDRDFVLKPLSASFKRFRGKDFRGERYDMNSSIQVSFDHPLSGNGKKMKVKDISGSGISISENSDKAVLFAGLVIPEMKIILPGNNSLSCKAQVIYSGREMEGDSDYVLAGLAILDMNPVDYSRLLDYIHHEIDHRSNICNSVDTNALWRFFFESGFIYPEKYKYLIENIEKIKELYEKLYTDQPAIARHFVYQKDNHIQGHMSMLRSYENSWLLHHHAASSINGQNSGLHVLNQVGSFTNNCHHIESMHLDFLLCYFRKENKFPNRMFGGLADGINDREKCSLDDWAYFHVDRDSDLNSFESNGWRCAASSEGELRDLQSFYEQRNSGLMLKAFNIDNGELDKGSLLRDFNESGFSRNIDCFTLKRDGIARAIIMIDQTDAGLNMSDLTNSLKVFILDPSDLDRSVIEQAMNSLALFYPGDNKISALAYPAESAKVLNLPIDKIYTMWVLNVEAGDSYFHHLKKLIRKIHH